MMQEQDSFDVLSEVKKWFSAESLINNMPFFLLVALLGIVYIANAHYHLQLERTIDKKETELKELGWEYMTVKSNVMYESKQSEVAKKVEVLGLKPLTEPPKVIELKK